MQLRTGEKLQLHLRPKLIRVAIQTNRAISPQLHGESHRQLLNLFERLSHRRHSALEYKAHRLSACCVLNTSSSFSSSPIFVRRESRKAVSVTIAKPQGTALFPRLPPTSWSTRPLHRSGAKLRAIRLALVNFQLASATLVDVRVERSLYVESPMPCYVACSI